MSQVVFWTGPVNLTQVKGATVPDARMINITCAGNGIPTCGQLADSWGATIPGTQPTDELFLGAFSAGGSALKRFLMYPSARAQTRAVMLADAMYTDWAAPGHPTPIEGFVLFALDAIAGNQLFVATVSATPNIATAAGNKGQVLPSGSQTMAATRDEIERRSGQSFVAIDPSTLGVTPAPVSAWRLGNVIFADYQMTVSHTGQAGIAAQYWQNVLQPWLASAPPPPTPNEPLASTPSGLGTDIIVGFAGVAIGFAFGWWLGQKGWI